MTTTSIEVNQSTTANLLPLPVPNELVLLTVRPLQKPTPAQVAESAARSEQNEWAYGIEEAAMAMEVFRVAKPKSDSKSALLILENEEAVEDAREMGIAAISIPASFKNSVPFIQKAVAELRDDNLSCLVYLGTGRAENIKQACGNAGVPFVALHPIKLFSPLPDKPTIGNLLDRMNPSQFIQKVENLLKDAALGIEAPLSLEEAAEEARKILLCHEMTDLQKNFELRKIRLRLDMNISEWKDTILNPLRDEVRLERLNLELLALLQIENRVEFLTQKGKLCSKYQMSGHLLDQMIAAMKQRTSTPEAEVIDVETLNNKTSTGLDWVIPELLPVGETALLIASPKVGKSLLGVDAAFAVATGESDFLGIPVKQGRVLFISVDESPSSTRQKLFNRGFRPEDKNVHIMLNFDVSQMAKLEAELEAFRPTLVVVDSLKRITHGVGISENSAEFGEIVYDLKELFTRYGASGILIHHSNKNPDALGVDIGRGSTAISSAAWGVWILNHISKPKPSDKKKSEIDPRDPKRALTVHSRGAEPKKMTVELEGEYYSWVTVNEDGGKEQAEQQKWQNRISNILAKNSKGLTSREIIELMGVSKENCQTVYATLNRMSNKQLIDEKPAPGKSRARIYSLPKLSQPPQSDAVNNSSQNPFTPPPPQQSDSFINSNSESIDMNEFEVTKPVTKPLLNRNSTNFSKTNSVESSNSMVERDSGVTKPIDNNRGGEGKNNSVELNQLNTELSQPPSETRENEVANCGADTLFSKVDVYKSNNSKSDKEQQTTGLTPQPRQMEITDVIVPQVAQTAPEVKKQLEVSKADIEAMANDIKDAKTGIMIMVLMATYYSQAPAIKYRVEGFLNSKFPEEWQRIEGLKEVAQDEAKPGAKCKIDISVGRTFGWVDARLLSATQDANGPVWCFELNDGQREDIFSKEDWLLSKPNDETAEFPEIDSPWDESQENDSQTAEQKRIEAMVRAATEKFQS